MRRFFRILLPIVGGAAVIFFLESCSNPEGRGAQGYVEGEFVYVAAPLPGALEALHAQRGAQVKAGDPLFTLESVSEKAARDEAERRLAQARANLEDAKKGKRPSEIESIEAQILQAQAASVLSAKELARQERLLPSHAASVEDVDRARSAYEQNLQRVAQLEADLRTARLGSRSDLVEAAQDEVRAREATLAKAEWDLSQKRQFTSQAALVFDTLYRRGDWVAAGRPVMVLLPPQNIKVRAFVPETRIASIHINDSVRVTVDGIQEPFTGKVSFISPKAEYTPPVIFSTESRSKLVFMIEIALTPEPQPCCTPGSRWVCSSVPDHACRSGH